MSETGITIAVDAIAGRIVTLRGQRIMLDSDLAALYGVPTKRLNEQVKRNAERFPADFMFRLNSEEIESLNRSQIATGSQKHRDPRFSPFAFTEHGAIMAATILNTPRAVEMSVYVVRAFVKLRKLLSSQAELARKLALLEKSVATLDASTRRQFEEVYEAILSLMGPRTRKQ